MGCFYHSYFNDLLRQLLMENCFFLLFWFCLNDYWTTVHNIVTRKMPFLFDKAWKQSCFLKKSDCTFSNIQTVIYDPVPLRIHLPLLPSCVMALLLFSVLWESERLSLLSSEPSSDSSFATSEMSFYGKYRVHTVYSFYLTDTRHREQSRNPHIYHIDWIHIKLHDAIVDM